MWLRHAPAAWRPKQWPPASRAGTARSVASPTGACIADATPNPSFGFTPSQKSTFSRLTTQKCTFCSRAIPHNSKCRYGERGAAAAKPKAQIILCAAKVSAASGGCSEPKQGQRSQSARGFCPEARCGYRNPTLSSILATQLPCRSRRSVA